MPETATQPNFSVDLPDSNAASPLLEGFNSTEPPSTLYLPIPEDTSANNADATSSNPLSLAKDSLASRAASQKMLGQRSKSTLSLVDKLSTKRRQLVVY